MSNRAVDGVSFFDQVEEWATDWPDVEEKKKIKQQQIDAIAKLWHERSTTNSFDAYLYTLGENEQKIALYNLFLYFQNSYLGITKDVKVNLYTDFDRFLNFLLMHYPQLGKFVETQFFTHAHLSERFVQIPILKDAGVAVLVKHYQEKGKLPQNIYPCFSIVQFFDKLLEMFTSSDQFLAEGSKMYFIVRQNISDKLISEGGPSLHRFAVVARRENQKIKLLISDSLALSKDGSFEQFKIFFAMHNPKYEPFLLSSVSEIAFVVNPRQVDRFSCVGYTIKDLIAIDSDQMETLKITEDPAALCVLNALREKLPSVAFVGYEANEKMMKSSQHLSKMPQELKGYLRNKHPVSHIRLGMSGDGEKEINFLSRDRTMKMFGLVLERILFPPNS